MARLTLIADGPLPADEAPLDAYSRVVTEVAERIGTAVTASVVRQDRELEVRLVPVELEEDAA